MFPNRLARRVTFFSHPHSFVTNSYAKEEFKRHKDASEAHSQLFMKEWTKYYVTLSNQIGRDARKRPIGKQLDEQLLDEFADDQLVQLHELYKELKGPLDGIADK